MYKKKAMIETIISVWMQTAVVNLVFLVSIKNFFTVTLLLRNSFLATLLIFVISVIPIPMLSNVVLVLVLLFFSGIKDGKNFFGYIFTKV
jgi:hypothetical protein